MRDERSHLEDQLLVMDAQDGSRKAMDSLVSRWQKRLWRHACRLTGDSQAAWDVTQTAWYDIIRRLHKLHDPAGFPAWAYKITTRRAIDWIKQKQRNKSIPLETIEPAETESKASLEMEDLLGQLDIDKRTILSLYYFEELKLSDIAIALKIPVGTVKSRLYAARNDLKQYWLQSNP